MYKINKIDSIWDDDAVEKIKLELKKNIGLIGAGASLSSFVYFSIPKNFCEKIFTFYTEIFIQINNPCKW